MKRAPIAETTTVGRRKSYSTASAIKTSSNTANTSNRLLVSIICSPFFTFRVMIQIEMYPHDIHVI
ncbi:hypothetical protein [Jeotgalibaca sp. A122]|uniref:hypothetical protein n=1 Tax=Jeotgalibaca sp. A122 TaxID=3457322 RepID=UPI003FD3134B